MYAITMSEPGGPETMAWTKVADPTPAAGEVIIDDQDFGSGIIGSNYSFWFAHGEIKPCWMANRTRSAWEVKRIFAII